MHCHVIAQKFPESPYFECPRTESKDTINVGIAEILIQWMLRDGYVFDEGLREARRRAASD